MKQYLFHQDIFIPDRLKRIVKKLQEEFEDYKLSNHFKDRLDSLDRSHSFNDNDLILCLDRMKKLPKEPFEVLAEKRQNRWVVLKYCVRIMYSIDESLCIVIGPYYDNNKQMYLQDRNKIITAWFNDNLDTHITLNEDNYMSEEEWKKILSSE